MNFETGPFFAASVALISSGLLDRRLAVIAWATCGRDAALRRPRVAAGHDPSFGRRSAPSLPCGSSVSFGIQPFHVISDAGLERIAGLIAKSTPNAGEIRLGKILVVRVRVLDVSRFDVRASGAVQHSDQVVARASLCA